jgi:hypothetical protein
MINVTESAQESKYVYSLTGIIHLLFVPMSNVFFDFYTFAEKQTIPVLPDKNISCISLRSCADQIITRQLSSGSTNTNTIVNKIHKDIYASTNKEIFCELLYRLFHSLLLHSQNSTIQVTAKMIGNIVIIHMRGNVTENAPCLFDSLKETEGLAEKIGGCISVSNDVYGFAAALTFVSN